jgi:transposase InsO family protein
MIILTKPDYEFRMKYINSIIQRYHKLDKKGKSKVIDQAVEILGYNRKYLIHLLNTPQSEIKCKSKITGRGRKKKYNSRIKGIIQDIWERSRYPWSLRLKKIILDWFNWIVDKYKLSEEEKRLLKSISISTIDRMLKEEKIKAKRRIYGNTKPGSLLKREIPIMTEFYDIDEPGHLEIDLVSHSGNNALGEFIYSLNVTDIYTGWSETKAIMGKGEYEVRNALDEIIKSMPFEIKSIDSDNGSEFINWHLYRYCQENKIVFTRSRPYKKDDNAHIEQKNWTNVRKLLGWDRYDSEESLNLINDLYRNEIRIYLNLFMPSVKLIKSERIGSRIRKMYDKPKTPFERLKEFNPR